MGLWGVLAEPLVPAAMGVTGSSHKPVHCNRRRCLSSCHVLSGASTCTENTFNFQLDNEAVITALDTKSCKDTSLMHMLRCLFFFQAHYFFSYTARHIPGIDNTLADALSRNNAVSFKGSQCGQNPDSHPPGTDGATSDPKARLDTPELDNLVQYYFEQGLSTSTLKTYKTGIKKFDEFCKKHKITNPLPVDQRWLCYYNTYLAQQGMADSTIRVYPSALRHHHIYDIPEPDRTKMPNLKLVDSAIRRIKDSKTNPPPCYP